MLHRLRDEGNTVVVIEHNLDVIKTADYVIDLGPEGGAGGGQIIATGTPEGVAANKASYTGAYLKPPAGAKPEADQGHDCGLMTLQNANGSHHTCVMDIASPATTPSTRRCQPP